jgi:uncharacterized protein
VVIHIVDRRLNPGGKSLENRQRFLRRAKSLVQAAVKKTSQDRDIKDVLEGGEVAIPLDRPSLRQSRNAPGLRTSGGKKRGSGCRPPSGGVPSAEFLGL